MSKDVTKDIVQEVSQKEVSQPVEKKRKPRTRKDAITNAIFEPQEDTHTNTHTGDKPYATTQTTTIYKPIPPKKRRSGYSKLKTGPKGNTVGMLMAIADTLGKVEKTVAASKNMLDMKCLHGILFLVSSVGTFFVFLFILKILYTILNILQ